MNMSDYEWADTFRQCYEKAVKLYRHGNRQPDTYFDQSESAFLSSIGCTAQELFDYAEDWCQEETPSFATVLLIAAARRDYFMVIQHGQRSSRTIPMSEFPAKSAEVAGFAWLPRLIVKARAKLRGEMPPELMYGCGGDRAFLSKTGIHPADFLRVTWSAGEDDRKIVAYVQSKVRA
jgi:hypothetical protein